MIIDGAMSIVLGFKGEGNNNLPLRLISTIRLIEAAHPEISLFLKSHAEIRCSH